VAWEGGFGRVVATKGVSRELGYLGSEGAAVLRANGPLVTKYMSIFAAKFGFAMHSEALGALVPNSGCVEALWLSNVHAARGELPMEIIQMLPPKQTLRQGKQEVSDQFEYSSQVTADGRHCVAYAVFRSSFAVFALTAVDRSEHLETPAGKLPEFRPGDFRTKLAALPQALTPNSK
jgi:hypothetical protein